MIVDLHNQIKKVAMIRNKVKSQSPRLNTDLSPLSELLVN